jgi:signal transduction histidine kinase
MATSARVSATATATAAVAAAVGALALAPSGTRLDAAAIAAVIAAYAGVGAVILTARPGHRVGVLMLVGALLWALGELGIAIGSATTGSAATLAGVLGTAARGAGWLVLVLLVPLHFPSGRPAGGQGLVRAAYAAVVLVALSNLLSPEPLDTEMAGVDNPIGLPHAWQWVADLLAVGAIALAAVVLVAVLVALGRHWRRDGELVRQQLSWLFLAFVPPVLLLPLAPTSLVSPWVYALVSLPVPVAVGVALLQRRLYDLQPVVSRTLTYAALSVTLAATYALVVAGVGALLRERGAAWLPWAAAGVVAVAFAPLREVLQRGVTRLTFGRWSAPAEVLATTGRRLADAADVPALLGDVTTEMVDVLGLAHAEVVDAAGRVLATRGTPSGEVEELALAAYGEPVGALRFSGGVLREADRALLRDLALQLGGVVHAAALVDQLRAARERVVLAAEQERRRLRADLHDGLGPALAGLGLLVDRAQNRLRAGEAVDDDLLALRQGLRTTVVDVRGLVEGLRPPAIDDLGLYGALAALGAGLTDPADLQLDLDLPEGRPSLPAAVEVAAYRVAQEALTNVVRHSSATRCRLRATVAADGLELSVSDDGRGFDASRVNGRGVGLGGMAERAREIGGSVEVGRNDEGGTTVMVRLPTREGAAR